MHPPRDIVSLTVPVLLDLMTNAQNEKLVTRRELYLLLERRTSSLGQVPQQITRRLRDFPELRTVPVGLHGS
jgi:hypothetical protein